MTIAPNLVVAGDPGVARRLRETGRFPAVFDAASAVELRNLSRSGQVRPPAAFMFAPGFVEDLPSVGVPVLAGGLVAGGFTVLVHGHFTERGDVFDPRVRVARGRLKLSELLEMLDAPRPNGASPNGASPNGASRSTESSGQAPAPGRRPPPQPVQSVQQPAPQPVQSVQQPPPALAMPPVGSLMGLPTEHGPAAAPAASAAWPGPGGLSPGTEPGSNSWPGPQAASSNPWVQAVASAPARRAKVIAVTSAKGGVGKTSMTVNLSIYAARLMQAIGRPGSVALLDTNFQQADIARYLNLDSPTILELFQNPGALSADSIRTNLAYIPEIDLYALLGPPEAINADPALFNASLYLKILGLLREAFEYIFIDTPVAELYHTTFTELILPEADSILVPVEPNRVTLEAARSWLRAITTPQISRGGGVDPAKLSLILNRARTDVGCGPEEVMDLIPGWRFIGMIPEDKNWMQAVNNRHLIGMRADPQLEATFRQILQIVTGEPAFATAPITPEGNGHKGGRLKKMFGL